MKIGGDGGDKDGAQIPGMQIFPTCADLFRRKKDDGRAEAAMIGAFAVRVVLENVSAIEG